MTIGDCSLQNFNYGFWQLPKAPVTFIRGFSSRSGKSPTPTQLDSSFGNQGSYIYGIIPLCTIFLHKSNGDSFRNKLHHSNFSPQIHKPFLRKTSEPFSLAIPGGYQKTIQGAQPPGPEGVGLYLLFRVTPRVISRGYQEFNHLSRHQVLQYSLDNSIGS
ncbi:hypothetical protein O181_112322 [Austropuccinia psidii MF-1]|uniref:Uncharacterized protein n=1 Tax=Austropuccinia psidii MF-1 TaxID=1389203 RepID=A0A9Q3K1L9_9BASI|nr:hypothetical protein [Austropuccinia psidii MF-1]